MSDLIEILTEIDADLSGNVHPQASSGSKALALQEAVGDPSHAWVIIDGASHLRLAVTARALGHKIYTLFEGQMAEEHSGVGPCLVTPKADGVFLRYFAQAHGENAGVVVCADIGLERLGDHLKHVFNVEDEEKRTFFFRFYDPRALRPFLEASDEGEIARFLGPAAMVVEDAVGYSMVPPQR